MDVNGITGTLYLVDSKLSITAKRESLTIPNGTGWSPDHRTLYFNHSSDQQILAFSYDESGLIRNERVLYHHKGEGVPDGLRMDEEGNLWTAIHGEGKVLRISPQGEVLGVINFPVPTVTCPVFVGTELFVTSEDDGKSEFGGAVFRIDVGVKGMEIFKFRLDA